MAHEHIYGICENKCQVEIPQTLKTYVPSSHVGTLAPNQSMSLYIGKVGLGVKYEPFFGKPGEQPEASCFVTCNTIAPNPNSTAYNQETILKSLDVKSYILTQNGEHGVSTVITNLSSETITSEQWSGVTTLVIRCV